MNGPSISTAGRSGPSASLDRGRDAQGRDVVTLAGRLDADAAGRLWAEAMDTAGPDELVLDASGLAYCDSAGASMIVAIGRACRAAGGTLSLQGLSSEYHQLVELLESGDAPDPTPDENSEPLVAALGRGALKAAADARVLVGFVGEVVLALRAAARHPGRVRWRDVVVFAERAGIGAIPIVALIGLLLGLILSFQAGLSMQKFGAEIYVADLVGISMIKELGPLMASVMLTARSASAFAAEIGTMKVNEEIDALTTMGLEPVRFLVVPRIIAAVLVAPALTMVMIINALIGGGIIMLTMGYPLTTYTNRLIQATSISDLGEGITKSLVFGLVVAAVGCQRGLQTRSGAGAVGLSTTSAVVSGIILIALIDGGFALCLFFTRSW